MPPSPLRRFVRDYGAWLLVWLPLALWFARPLWSAKILPLHDLPNSLAQITALHYLDDPRWNLSEFYERALGPVPYLGHFLPVHWLAYLTRSVSVANVVYLIAYVMTAPLCGLAFARATGRSPWLALLLLPVSVGYFFQWGFVSFCVGTMLMLPAAAMLYRTVDEPTRGRYLALALYTAALYFCHVLPWGAFGLYAGVILLVEIAAGRARPAFSTALALLPSVGLFLLGLWRARQTGFLDTGHEYLAQADTPSALVGRIGSMLNLFRKTEMEDWAQLGAAALFLLLLSTDGGETIGVPLRKRLRVPLAILVFLLLASVTPFWVKRPFNWWMINPRFLMMAAAFAVFLPRGAISGWRSGVLVSALAVTTLLPLQMARCYKDFSKRAEPIVRLLLLTPHGSNTLLLHTRTAAGYRFDDGVLSPDITVWRELYNYPLIVRGGYDPYIYPNGFPIRPKKHLRAPKVETAMISLGNASEGKFDPPRMLFGWDYLLVKEDNQTILPPDGLSVVQKDHDWILFRNLLKDVPPAPDPPPGEAPRDEPLQFPSQRLLDKVLDKVRVDHDEGPLR